MTTYTEAMFQRYGCPVLIEAPSLAEPVSARALVQPMRYKNSMYLEGTYTPVGYEDGGHCFYIGPPSIRVDQIPFPTLTAGGATYRFKRAEAVYIGDKIAYIWGVLQLKYKTPEEV